jgi:hypothetical protein
MGNSKIENRKSKGLARGARALGGLWQDCTRDPQFTAFEFRISNFEFNQ